MGNNRSQRRSELRLMFKELMADKYSKENCKLSRRQRRQAARFEAKVAQRAFRKYLADKEEKEESIGTAKATLVKATDLQENEAEE